MTLLNTLKNSKHINSVAQRLLKLKPLEAFFAGTIIILFICFFEYISPVEDLISPLFKHLVFLILIYSTLTLSLNFVSGYIGQTSFGHAAFFGLGAYVSAILVMNYQWNFWLAFLVAGVTAAALGIPLGLPALRVKGNFLAVITYGFAEVLRFIAINSDITGGPGGLPGVPSPVLFLEFASFGPTGKELFIILAFLLASVLAYFMFEINKSRLGYAFSAIREDEIAASAMGININYYKVLAFVTGAFFAGLAGSIFAHYTTFVSPETLICDQSTLILTMVCLGGPRSIKGSFVGATILIFLPEFLRTIKELLNLPFDPWLITYGLILILLMRLRPQGLFGESI
ncbi:MAG: branched-chain amino acid ABC transporter permease [Negativicutes bacterium]